MTSAPPNTPRERILRSARTLFAEKGYEHASTSAIARAAGTSESQMMKYFGSKLGLLQAIFEEAWVEITAAAGPAAEQAASGREKIHAMVGALLAFVNREPELRLLFLLESRRVRRDDHSVALSGGYMGFIAMVDEVLEGMRREGSLRPDLPPPAVRSALFGMLEGMLRDHLLNERAGKAAAWTTDDVGRMFDLALSAFTAA